ncbi:MAG: zinc-binding dehydrogenase [Alphaproteobacteria bacterium]|nr:zinc-binding dehydrogenase [Alphaproteobacteria bacterium]MCY4231858.1 zinc-binding dehydrogenase [Alphaproteobacteria bacterium]MCY4320015.1 zinc-binding dehydrogenase [Alphaproteobacteria bacterium]
MTAVVRIRAGSAAPVVEDEIVEPPGAGEVQLRQTAFGLDRCGLVPPAVGRGFVPGIAAAGQVETVGIGVQGIRPGDRLAYADLPGAWRAHRNVPAHRLVPIPDDIDDRTAAALIRRGLAVHYLLRRLRRVQPGEILLATGAAGSVGRLLSQWAAAIGAEVIGAVGSVEKAGIARANGCARTVVAGSDDSATQIREAVGELGANVAYDALGGEIFARCLDCLAPTGMLIGFGDVAGSPPPLPLERLEAHSLILARPTLNAWTADPDALIAASEELFELVGAGKLRPGPVHTFPLAEAGDAVHALLDRRNATYLALTD